MITLSLLNCKNLNTFLQTIIKTFKNMVHGTNYAHSPLDTLLKVLRELDTSRKSYLFYVLLNLSLSVTFQNIKNSSMSNGI